MTILSVILPNYNHSRFLRFSLGALLSQDRQPDEIIVIDDASTDDSVAVISSLLIDQPRARLVRHEHNRGVNAALNAGLAMARGDLVYFAAADDEVLPGLFSRSISMLEQFPQAALCSALSTMIDVGGHTLGVLPGAVPLSRPGYLPPASVRSLLEWDDTWIHGNTVIYRRQMIADIGGLPPELQSYADGFITRALAFSHGACFIPEPLGAWRRLEGGYSWTFAADIEKARHVAENTVRLMQGEFAPVFSRRYTRRWPGRYLFGARRLALVVCLKRESSAASDWPRRLWCRLKYAAAVVYWFARLRPLDAPAVARRRLRQLVLPDRAGRRRIPGSV